jgi:hypothetical protein
MRADLMRADLMHAYHKSASERVHRRVATRVLQPPVFIVLLQS